MCGLKLAPVLLPLSAAHSAVGDAREVVLVRVLRDERRKARRAGAAKHAVLRRRHDLTPRGQSQRTRRGQRERRRRGAPIALL